MARKHLSQLPLPEAGIRSAAFTAHGCPSSGSSLCRPVPDPHVVSMMAPPVYQLQVVDLVRSAEMARCVMMCIDERKVLVRIEANMAQGAPVVLSLQQCQAHRGVHDLRHASMLPDLPVVPVVGIERTALSLNLAVPGDRDVVVSCEPGFAIREVPVGVEVSRSDPRRRLRRVSTFGPAP